MNVPPLWSPRPLKRLIQQQVVNIPKKSEIRLTGKPFGESFTFDYEVKVETKSANGL